MRKLLFFFAFLFIFFAVLPTFAQEPPKKGATIFFIDFGVRPDDVGDAHAAVTPRASVGVYFRIR